MMSFAFTCSLKENQGQFNFEEVHPSHGWLPGVLGPSRASCGYLHSEVMVILCGTIPGVAAPGQHAIKLL